MQELKWENLNRFGKIYLMIIASPFLLGCLFCILLLMSVLIITVLPIYKLLFIKDAKDEDVNLSNYPRESNG
jgi:hypothetical protein